MMAAQDFNQIIGDKYPQLTKGEKQIANYLRKNQDESAFLSVGELAERLELSEATVVRFARKWGFDSFPAMREALQENFRRRVGHSARLRSRLDELREAGDIFEKVTVSEIDYLTEALQTVDRGALHQAVDRMIACEHIYVFATGPSVSLVHILNLRLTRFGKQVIPLTTAGREALEPLPLMTDRDLLFAIGFFDVNPALQIVLDYAREVSCPCHSAHRHTGFCDRGKGGHSPCCQARTRLRLSFPCRPDDHHQYPAAGDCHQKPGCCDGQFGQAGSVARTTQEDQRLK
jgi:DNA-binding MurR/RpiR family transcriptional regulator